MDKLLQLLLMGPMMDPDTGGGSGGQVDKEPPQDSGSQTTEATTATAATATTTTTETGQQGSSSIDLTAVAPDEVKEATWFKEILKNDNPLVALLNQNNNAQKTIGKPREVIVPGKDATDEDWSNYRKALGVPDTTDSYKYDDVSLGEDEEEFSQYLNSVRDQELLGEVSKIFQSKGVPPAIASSIVKEYEDIVIARHRQQFEEFSNWQKEQDLAFADEAKKVFGAESDKALEEAGALLAKAVPDAIKPRLKTMGANDLITVAMILKNNLDLYGREDVLKSSYDDRIGDGNDRSDAEARANKIMASEAYQRADHPNHRWAREQARKLYKLAYPE